jgi:hypothetical protein
MEQPGIVFIVRPLELHAEMRVNAISPGKMVQHLVLLDSPVLADPQEDNPVDDQLDGAVDLFLRKGKIA